ncbi:MAG TPA: hypothetical protein DD477_11130 [Spirochaetaceae bacterium]|nr:hypothetical protein [Spirochaetaceae bacterium]HAX38344.1 hypothetical protein [Spirochaetaceae bacterium]HBO41750.1 hypothetical protein [Spirochaetaceae bacterium]
MVSVHRIARRFNPGCCVIKKILVIDSEEFVLEGIKLIFGDLGHQVDVFSDFRPGLNGALANG